MDVFWSWFSCSEKRDDFDDGQAVVLNCLREMPPGYIVISPVVFNYEEWEDLGEIAWYAELGNKNWNQINDIFERERTREELKEITIIDPVGDELNLHGTFSIEDPNQRIIPVADMKRDLSIYYCCDMKGPPGLNLDYPFSVVIIEEPRTAKKRRKNWIAEKLENLILQQRPPTTAKRMKIISCKTVTNKNGEEEEVVDIVTISVSNVKINFV